MIRDGVSKKDALPDASTIETGGRLLIIAKLTVSGVMIPSLVRCNVIIVVLTWLL